MPSGVALTYAVAVKNRLYLIGGVAITGGAILSSVYSTSISGGISDYSHLYDDSINKFDDSDISGSVALLDEANYNYGYFPLPDLSISESGGINYYIKY